MEPRFRVRILAVDDKPGNLLALQAVLEQQGYDMAKALSGLEAVELAQREDFAAISKLFNGLRVPSRTSRAIACAAAKGCARAKEIERAGPGRFRFKF